MSRTTAPTRLEAVQAALRENSSYLRHTREGPADGHYVNRDDFFAPHEAKLAVIVELLEAERVRLTGGAVDTDGCRFVAYTNCLKDSSPQVIYGPFPTSDAAHAWVGRSLLLGERDDYVVRQLSDSGELRAYGVCGKVGVPLLVGESCAFSLDEDSD